MSNVPGLFVLGEANFSDHGANRLGASALMQGLADGYFVAPYTIGNYLAGVKPGGVPADHPEVKRTEQDVADRLKRLLAVNGKQSVTHFHRELGKVMWEKCGMARTEASLKDALARVPQLRDDFWKNVSVTGTEAGMNKALEVASRVADFLEFGELLAHDALNRNESCGAHFREEYQYEDGEAKRDDEHYSHVSAWEYQGPGKAPVLHKEPLVWENVHPSVRSYK
jgi:succinate dehydrogenase / fumarate reductase flavoprotein subunit